MKRRKFLVYGVLPLLLLSCGGPAQESSQSQQPSIPSSQPSSEPIPSSEPTPSSESSSSEEKKREKIRKEVEVEMAGHFGEHFGEDHYKDKAVYDDAWFLEDSSKLNAELAVFSAMAGGADTSTKIDNNGGKIQSLLEATGFEDIEKNAYFSEGLKLRDSMGAIIGRKELEDDKGKVYTLLAVFPRSAGYGQEWYGNFEMGEEGMHKGFKDARDEMLRFLKQYITSNEIKGDLKLYCAGYSRGAAVANLFGGFLAEGGQYLGKDVSLASKDIYVYTIGTPKTLPDGVSYAEALSVSGPRAEEGYKDTDVAAYPYTGEGRIDLSSSKYDGIHNFAAIGDYVAKLPFDQWGFSRYGKTADLLYGSPEMLEDLKLLSEETAKKFEEKGNYSTELPTKEIDFENLAIKDSEKKISMDGLLDERLSAVLTLGNSRQDIVSKGYPSLLGAVTTLFGTDTEAFLAKAKDNLSGAIKAGALSYLTSAVERMGKSDAEGVAAIAMDLVELLGKKIEDRSTYTDQQFLADILTLVVTDAYSTELGKARAERIASLLPENYAELYRSVLAYAEKGQYAPKTVEDLLKLIADYVHEHETDAAVTSLIDMLAGVFPTEYAPYLGLITGNTYSESDYESPEALAKAALLDLLHVSAIGRKNDDGSVLYTPEQVRGILISLLGAIAFADYDAINALLANGSYNDNGMVTKEPALLSVFVDDVLAYLCGKDEEGTRLTLAQGADKALGDLLDALKYEEIDTYCDMLKEKPAMVREVLVKFLFNPGETYSLVEDVNNAVTFIDAISFIAPAHYHEMYVSYLKTMLPKA